MNQRYQEAKFVTLIGGIINALLTVAKLISGFLFHSHALIADGIHSFSDLLIDVMVLVATKFGNQDADDSHPYGHQRIETAATLLLALLLILAGAGLAWDALNEVMQHSPPPASYALIIAIFSLIINEILFRYTLKIGQKISSNLIIANAWHHRSDAASSAVVTLGILASLLGWGYCDAIAAVIVGLMIIKMGASYGWDSVKELIDTAVDAETLFKIEQIICHIDGVKSIHQLRSRFMGGDIYIDVNILVDPLISVSEGHAIAQHVHQALVKQFEKVKDVVIHIDSEDDENFCPTLGAPTRQTLEQTLLLGWQQQFPDLKSWTLHYLDGKIRLDLFYKNSDQDVNGFITQIKKDLVKWPLIKKVYLFSHHQTIEFPGNELC